MGIALLAFILFWMKRQTNKGSYRLNVLFWFVAATSLFYMLNVGVSFGIAMVMCAVIYLLKNKYYPALVKFLKSALLVSGVFLILALIIFNFEFKDLFDWILNFTNVALSNQNWAYGFLAGGKLQHLMLIINYLILPIITLFIAVLRFTDKNNFSNIIEYTIIFLIVAFFMNASRIIVRHNLLENNYEIVAFEWLIFLLLLLDVFYDKVADKKRRNIVYTPILLALSSIVVIFPFVAKTQNHISAFVNNLNSVSRSVYDVQGDIEYKLNPVQQKKATELSNFFDLVLEENETYIDFTNNTELYALVERKNPVYVNQSPGLVNGEKGQVNFINSVCESKIPIVLMPADEQYYLSMRIDGIMNADRYYLITEYICNNYRPLCKIENYVIWSAYDKYEEYKKDIGNNYELVDSYFYNTTEYYTHSLGYIPYVWSNYDSKDATLEGGVELEKSDNNRYIIPNTTIDCSEGNYLIFDIVSNSNTGFEFTLNNNQNHISKYSFNVLQGKNSYKIRVSSDISWYSKELESLYISDANGVTIDSIVLCKGDVLN